jgi:hypothetical protein
MVVARPSRPFPASSSTIPRQSGRKTPIAVHGAAELPPERVSPIRARYALVTPLFVADGDAPPFDDADYMGDGPIAFRMPAVKESDRAS